MIVEKACWERGCACYDYRLDEGVEVTLAQREWVGLTDEEIKDTLEAAGMDTWFSYRHAARAIEAKLKEKNHAL